MKLSFFKKALGIVATASILMSGTNNAAHATGAGIPIAVGAGAVVAGIGAVAVGGAAIGGTYLLGKRLWQIHGPQNAEISFHAKSNNVVSFGVKGLKGKVGTLFQDDGTEYLKFESASTRLILDLQSNKPGQATMFNKKTGKTEWFDSKSVIVSKRTDPGQWWNPLNNDKHYVDAEYELNLNNELIRDMFTEGFEITSHLDGVLNNGQVHYNADGTIRKVTEGVKHHLGRFQSDAWGDGGNGDGGNGDGGDVDGDGDGDGGDTGMSEPLGALIALSAVGLLIARRKKAA